MVFHCYPIKAIPPPLPSFLAAKHNVLQYKIVKYIWCLRLNVISYVFVYTHKYHIVVKQKL